MANLDLIDKQILTSLNRNCRQQTTQIARHWGIRRTTAAYRIKQLQQYIHTHYCMPNYKVEKISLVKIYLQLNKTNNSLGAWLAKHDHSIQVIQTEGLAHYTVVIATQSSYDIAEFMKDVEGEFPQLVSSYLTNHILSTHYDDYSRFFKLDDKPNTSNVSQPLTQKEKTLLRYLRTDPQIKATKLAQKLRQGAQTTVNQLRSIEKKMRFGIILNPRQLNWFHFVICIKSTNFSEQQRTHVKNLTQIPQILFVSRCIGVFEYEINAIISHPSDFGTLSTQIQDILGGNITDTVQYLNNEIISFTPIPTLML